MYILFLDFDFRISKKNLGEHICFFNRILNFVFVFHNDYSLFHWNFLMKYHKIEKKRISQKWKWKGKIEIEHCVCVCIYIYIYIYIYHIKVPKIPLALSTNHPKWLSLLSSLDSIQCLHRSDECKFFFLVG